MKSTYILFGSVYGFFVLFVSIGSAANYTFNWDPPHPNDNVVKYKIYYRMNSSIYNVEEDFELVPKPNSDQKFNPANPVWKIELPNVAEEYCFTATAINAKGFESNPSEGTCKDVTQGVTHDQASGDDGGGGCFIWEMKVK